MRAAGVHTACGTIPGVTVTAADRAARMALGVDGVRWRPRSSKPLWGRVAVLGGFDSHALPPPIQLQVGLRIEYGLDS